MKQQTCKYTLEDGTKCGSIFHTAMFHKELKPIKRTLVKKNQFSGMFPPETAEMLLDAVKQIKKPRKKSTPRALAKKKTPTRSQLVKKLDAVFSKYVRLRDDGKGCVTCGDRSIPKEQMQNCHFFSRGRLPTRWDETNCHAGCYRCNVLLKGNYIPYTMYMIDRYGREYVDKLEKKSKSNIKISSVELKEMIEKYTELVKAY